MYHGSASVYLHSFSSFADNSSGLGAAFDDIVSVAFIMSSGVNHFVHFQLPENITVLLV